MNTKIKDTKITCGCIGDGSLDINDLEHGLALMNRGNFLVTEVVLDFISFSKLEKVNNKNINKNENGTYSFKTPYAANGLLILKKD